MCDAMLLDLSPFGARIHSSGSMQPGQIVMLIESTGERRCLRCEVRWVGKEGRLHRNAGLQFLEVAEDSPQAADSSLI
jgi:PilZ domain